MTPYRYRDVKPRGLHVILKRLLARLLRWELVITTDHNGAQRVRRVYVAPDGNRVCRTIRTNSWVVLLPKGVVVGYNEHPTTYVNSWRPDSA